VTLTQGGVACNARKKRFQRAFYKIKVLMKEIVNPLLIRERVCFSLYYLCLLEKTSRYKEVIMISFHKMSRNSLPRSSKFMP